MSSSENEDGAWFAPKRNGYGSGLPIAWQGWALLFAFLAGIAAATLLITISLIAYATIVALLTALFVLISARTTRGGWHWRWKGRR
ncbi:MAG TPA: hypothetical protein VK472_02180 [Allosphingosinicella sp.]|nr:hypothetical protein [Allosphingosinicella sp.]